MAWPARGEGPATGRLVQPTPFHSQVSPLREEPSKPPKSKTRWRAGSEAMAERTRAEGPLVLAASQLLPFQIQVSRSRALELSCPPNSNKRLFVMVSHCAMAWTNRAGGTGPGGDNFCQKARSDHQHQVSL